jgi:hypothetical protein
MPDLATPAPMPEDLRRKASGDLAACDSATRGPWHFDWCDGKPHGIVSKDGTYAAVLGDDETHLVTVWEYPDDGVTDDCSNGDFIVLARTALPAWMRRARAAEAERDALGGDVAAADQGCGGAGT